MGKSQSFFKFFIPALLVGASLLLIVAIAFYFLGYKKPLEKQAQYYLQSKAEQVAVSLDQKVRETQQKLEKVVQDNDNEEAIIQQIAQLLPEIHTAKFVGSDEINVALQGSPAITHVTTELFRKALAGENPKPELILNEGKAEYIAFVLLAPNLSRAHQATQSKTSETIVVNDVDSQLQKVQDEAAREKAAEEQAKSGAVIERPRTKMLLLATLNPSRLAYSLSGAEGVYSLGLQQHYADGTHFIATSADSSVSTDGRPLLESKKFGANWSVALWQDTNAFAPSWILPLLLLILAVAALLVTALVPYFTMNKTMKSEARTFIRGITTNKMPSNFKLGFFNELAASYRRVHAEVEEEVQTEIKPVGEVALDENEDIKGKFDVDLLAVGQQISRDIFREYDIRGIVGENLNKEIIYALGRAIGSEAYARGEQKVLVARDGRLSSPVLHNALIQGLISSGRDVIDLGMAPTPVMYYATQAINVSSGVMLTGSHNPAKHNGLKVVLAGETLHGRDIQQLRKRIKDNDLLSGKGQVKELDLEQGYLEKVVSDIQLDKPLKVAIDCGNGVTGKLAPRLFQALGCEVVALYTEVDGNFPNHHPDPNLAANLQDLVKMVQQESADIGIAFDGDGDRLGVVDSRGKIIWTDRLMMLFAADVLSRNHGAEILFDVKCSRHLPEVIRQNGGNPLMWKTGHSLMKAKMRETGAPLAGEGSGHVYFKERWNGFDDGLYAAARLLELLAKDVRTSEKVFTGLPESLSTEEINVAVPDKIKFELIEMLGKKGTFDGANINSIDGIRAEYENGWFLIRPSNTTPSVVVKFEADNEIVLDRLKSILREQLRLVSPKLKTNF